VGLFEKIRKIFRPDASPEELEEARRIREQRTVQRMGASGRTALHGRDGDYRPPR
jgi:hypothetical protein